MKRSSCGKATWRGAAREGRPKPVVVVGAAPTTESTDEAADALTMAAMQGDKESVVTLLRAGGDADAKDAIGVAPLHWAAFCGHSSVTGQLLACNADVHVRDQEGRTPLHVAAYESHSEVIAQLVAAGADVMAPDKSARARCGAVEGSFGLPRSTAPILLQPCGSFDSICARRSVHSDVDASALRRLEQRGVGVQAADGCGC